jgi:pilus assembly protein CpaC
MKRPPRSAWAWTSVIALTTATVPVIAVSLVLPSMGHAQYVNAYANKPPAIAPKTVAAVNAATSPPPPGDPAVADAPPVLRGVKRRLADLPPSKVLEPGVLHIDLSNAGPTARVVDLPLGMSALVDLPRDAQDVVVANPAIARAVPHSRRGVLVEGVAIGKTDAVFFDASGQKILSLDVRVSHDSSGLTAAIGRLFPGSHIQVEPVNDSLVLAGEVANASDADKAVRLATRFVAKPEQIVNLMTITGREQVMLKVRIVEMQRNIIKQLGFNSSAVLNQVGMPQYMFSQAATYGVNGGIQGGLSGGYSLNTQLQPELADPNNTAIHYIARNGATASNYQTAVATATAGTPGLNQASSMIQAFERVGLVRTLAEPNLTAISGESAKFLAGGEYPVPVGEDNTGRVTVEFKTYGVGLNFTPVVMSEGRISLKIATEVSQLSNQGAFTLSNSSTNSTTGATTTGSSLNIPGLTVRRTETTIELPSGGAMMIAGLLQQQSSQDIDSSPGLMNMPVLGALFRSRDYLSGETELVVIVTPYLVKPTSPDKLKTPIDGLQMASDLETDLLGKMNKTSHVPPAVVAGKRIEGPYGYVIE